MVFSLVYIELCTYEHIYLFPLNFESQIVQFQLLSQCWVLLPLSSCRDGREVQDGEQAVFVSCVCGGRCAGRLR
jgi:hypothetical protein